MRRLAIALVLLFACQTTRSSASHSDASPGASSSPPAAAASAPPPEPALPESATWRPAADSPMSPAPPTPVPTRGKVSLVASDAAGLRLVAADDASVFALTGPLEGGDLVRAPSRGGAVTALDLGPVHIESAAVAGAFVYVLDVVAARGRLLRVPIEGGRIDILARQLADPCGLVADEKTIAWRESPGGLRAMPVSGGAPVTLYAGAVDCPIALAGDDVLFVARRSGKATVARLGRSGGGAAFASPDPSRIAEDLIGITKAIGGPAFDAGRAPAAPYDAVFDLQADEHGLAYIGECEHVPNAFVQAVVRPDIEGTGAPLDVSSPEGIAIDGAYVDVVSSDGSTWSLSRVSRSKQAAASLVNDTKTLANLAGSCEGRAGCRARDVFRVRVHGQTLYWSDANAVGAGGAIWAWRP